MIFVKISGKNIFEQALLYKLQFAYPHFTHKKIIFIGIENMHRIEITELKIIFYIIISGFTH